MELANLPHVRLIMIGGMLRQMSYSLAGPPAEQTLRGLHADRLFLGVDGLDPEIGLMTPDVLEAQLNAVMIQVSREVVVVADASKFQRRSLSVIAKLDVGPQGHHRLGDEPRGARRPARPQRRGARRLRPGGGPPGRAMESNLWFFYAVVTMLFWGVWGAFIERPEKNGFPATLGYAVWALTMVPCALVALALIGWVPEHDLRSVAPGLGGRAPRARRDSSSSSTRCAAAPPTSSSR